MHLRGILQESGAHVAPMKKMHSQILQLVPSVQLLKPLILRVLKIDLKVQYAQKLQMEHGNALTMPKNLCWIQSN